MQHPSKIARTLSAALVLTGLLGAQSQATPTTTDLRPAPQSVLDGFHTKKATLQELSLPSTAIPGFEVQVVLDGKTRSLVLREHDVRTKDYKLMVSDANGIRTLPTSPNTTYRGVLTEVDNAAVAASLIDGQLEALIRLENGELWSVQPLTKVQKNANRATHVVHRGGDSNAPQGTCPVGGEQAVDPGPRSAMSGGPIYECELACDADYQFYQQNSSNVTATENNIKGVVNALNVIYKRDVEIDHAISTIIVRTSVVYTNNNYSQLLTDFRSRWISYHGGVKRDVAHLFTGKNRVNSVIGVAYLSGICSSNTGYGLSFSNYTSNFNNRVGLTAHELGHNWGANHCSGSACYIMCAGLGGCGRDVTKFGTGSISAIVGFRNSRSCLTQQNNGAVLTSMSPSKVDVFRGATVTLTGSKFTGATVVNVGATQLKPPFGFTVVNDTKITFEPPTAKSIFPVKVSVESTGGKSNELSLSFQPTAPPLLDAYPIAYRNQLMLWEFGAFPNHNWILVVSPSPSTFKFLGFDWLQTPIILFAGPLDAAGYGSAFVAPVPSSTTVGLKFYSQIVTINPIASTLAGNTNVTTTEVK